MRRILADVDGVRHAALVLRIEGRPVGIARYVMTGVDEAEFAIAIAAEFSQRGFGRALLDRLVAHAHGHGVTRLYFEFQAQNLPARQLVHRYGATLRLDGAKYCGVLPTAPVTATPLEQAAAG